MFLFFLNRLSLVKSRSFTLSHSLSLSIVVNVARSQLLYNSLVSVDVQEEQLISAVLQDRLLVALPPSQCSGLEAEEAPSHLLFTPSLLIRQKPLPSEDKPVVTQGPSTHRLRCFFPRKTAVE